jgi:hypothetical protein
MMRTDTLSPQRSSRSLLIGLGAAAAIGVALLALALFLAQSQPALPAPTGELSQVSEGGEVTVKATWRAGETAPTFDIALDTHSVALDSYDLRELAVLRADGREVAPSSWEAPAGGHHRSGTLIFPATAADGTPLFTAQTRLIELVIRDVGDVPERVLAWTP